MRSHARRILHDREMECRRYTARVPAFIFDWVLASSSAIARATESHSQVNSTFHPISNHWCSYVERHNRNWSYRIRLLGTELGPQFRCSSLGSSSRRMRL